MLRSVVIDDEKNSREVLTELLKLFEVEVIAEANNVQAGVKLIRETQPDLVFLDIEMPVENGFELFNYFDEINFQVVFVTAYNQYAVKAFQCSATDYLLKPVDTVQIRDALKKVKEKRKLPIMEKQLEILLNQIRGEERRKIALPTPSGYHFAKLEDIVWLEADANYTTIHLQDNKNILSSQTLGKYEDLLPEDTFFRSHKSAIVNLNFVDDYLKKDDGLIVLQNDIRVPLGRRRKNEFITHFKSK